jgi:tetratricopeptide (TPR) repeat protein
VLDPLNHLTENGICAPFSLFGILMKRKNKSYINHLTKQFGEIGFNPDPVFFDEENTYQWLKPAFDGTCYFISVFEASSMDYDNAFSCHLGIASDYMTDTVNRLKIHECIEQNLSMAADLDEEVGPLYLMQVALHWILLDDVNAPDKVVWPAMTTSAQDNARELVDDIQQYGLPLLEKANSETKLIDFLLDIDNYPHREGLVKGPESTDSDVYAAFYLMKLGRTEEAVATLNLAYNIEKADIHQMWTGYKEIDNILAQFERIFAQYRQVIK